MTEQGAATVSHRPAAIAWGVRLLVLLIALVLLLMVATGVWISRNGDPLLGVFGGANDPYPAYVPPSDTPASSPALPGVHAPLEQWLKGLA